MSLSLWPWVVSGCVAELWSRVESGRLRQGRAVKQCPSISGKVNASNELKTEASGDSKSGNNTVTLCVPYARVLYQFFRVGVSPTDLKDSNTILQLPRTPSNENFSTFPTCPFRRFIHIDFTFDETCPQSSGHAYSPRAFIIDLEKAVFYSEDSPIVGEADIQDCRVNTIQRWLINDSLRWMEPAVIYTVLAPYGVKPYQSSFTTSEPSST
ncbi:hypothetical protein B0H12DRAFT_1258451 [Mycena haematopus]|nr:hypothetical protein B0H12DRAFT_1258451 [Mycena haematopus]